MTIDEYQDSGRALYAEFSQAVAAVLRAAICEEAGLHLQNIQHRAKDVASLRVKLARAGATEDAAIGDAAKDVAGCRLIFYTNGDVYRFGQSGILRNNFDVDFERSKIHYPANSDEGAEFFISENWVVRFSEARCGLPEYRRFAGLSCEVQVQTILDHSWAEMAHDTIYKPMTDDGFGAGAIEEMRKRLRKVMRNYLQPAGYEFDKIASDFSRLQAGKAMFDEDALAVIRACGDCNSLDEAIERFDSYVLPNYSDYIAAAREIIDALTDAAVRSISLPDVPREAYFGEYPGIKPEAVIDRVCSVLESPYLLYAEPDRMFDALVEMRAAAQTDKQRQPVDKLTKRFGQHDLRAWKRVGAGLQRLILDRIAALDDSALVNAAPTLTRLLREALSSTVTGTTWQAATITLHMGSVGVNETLKAMRRDALEQLRRLHALVDGEEARAAARNAMMAAGDTPNNSGYSDALGVVIIDDLVEVVRFLTEVFPTLGLEPKRELEVNVFRVFYRYHALPKAMADNPDLVAAQARLLITIADCRAAIDADDDLVRYRELVGHDSVSRKMWDKACYDFEGTAAERTTALDAMIATIDHATEAEWLARLERYVETRSDDMATFKGLEELIKKLAKVKPAILLGWMPRLSDRLANWLPGMLHGLAEAGQEAVIDPIIERWINEDRHLSSIGWYLQFADSFRFDLLAAITNKGLAAGDDQILGSVAFAAARQSNRHPEKLFEEVFLPAARSLTERGDFRWKGGMFNWDQLDLLKGLSAGQVKGLMPLMAVVPRLGSSGEAMLAVVGREHVEAVIELIGTRFMQRREAFDTHYEDLPYSLVYLQKPLVEAPVEVVAAARRWFDKNSQLAEFRGGRLIAEVFPKLESPIGELLGSQIEQGREGFEFALSVLRAYEGQSFLHPLLRDIVAALGPDDELLGTVRIVIESSGVLVGEYGSVEAQEERKALVAEWGADERQAVRDFAAAFVKSADNTLARERRRADRSVAMRRIGYED